MGWKFWEKKSSQCSTSVLGHDDELAEFLLFGTSGNAASPASAVSLYNRSTAVSIPVNMIADAFSSIKPVMLINDTFVTEHEILNLINVPSPYYTRELFFEAIAKDYLITGNEVVVAVGGVNRPPLELQPISSTNISPVQGQGGIAHSIIVTGNTLAGSYKLVLGKKQARYIKNSLTELNLTRMFSTKDNSLLLGQSPLVTASAEARQNIKGNTHNIALLDNGGKLSMVFNIEGDLSQEDFEAAEKNIHAKYSGATKAGMIGVTSGGKLDIKEVGSNNKDMDYVNMQNQAKQSIALQYKVPLPLVTTDASTFNNYSEAKLALYDDAVLPLADRIFAGLTQLLVPRYGLDPAKVQITYNPDKITALETRRNSNLKLRKDLNIETTDELRDSVGLEAVEGGDKIMVSATMVPLGSDPFTQDEPTLNRDSSNE